MRKSLITILAVTAVVIVAAAPAWGALLVSAEFQSASAVPNNYSGNEPLAVALDPVFSSSGTTWNQLLLPQYSATITDPSFSSLTDRGTGLATSVGFAITGGGKVAGYQNAWVAGNALTRDIMIFGNFNGMSTAFDWQISGLTAGAAFKLVLYGSATTLSTVGAYQQVDTNGDGVVSESSVLVSGAVAPVLFTGTVGSTGLIKGHAVYAGAQGDWSGFQLSVIPEPATMSLLALGGLAALIRRRRA